MILFLSLQTKIVSPENSVKLFICRKLHFLQDCQHISATMVPRSCIFSSPGGGSVWLVTSLLKVGLFQEIPAVKISESQGSCSVCWEVRNSYILTVHHLNLNLVYIKKISFIGFSMLPQPSTSTKTDFLIWKINTEIFPTFSIVEYRCAAWALFASLVTNPYFSIHMCTKYAEGHNAVGVENSQLKTQIHNWNYWWRKMETPFAVVAHCKGVAGTLHPTFRKA